MSSNYDYADLFDKANNKVDLLQNSNDKQDQEIYIEAKMALVEIQQLCEASSSIPVCEIVQKYYDEASKRFVSSQEKKLKNAENYCILQKETAEETKKILDNVKKQLQAEKDSFKKQFNYLFDALNLKLNV